MQQTRRRLVRKLATAAVIRRQTVEADIEARIVALHVLTTGELQTEWSRLYRAQPPIRLSRDLFSAGSPPGFRNVFTAG